MNRFLSINKNYFLLHCLKLEPTQENVYTKMTLTSTITKTYKSLYIINFFIVENLILIILPNMEIQFNIVRNVCNLMMSH